MGDNTHVGNVEGLGIAVGTGASVNIYGDIRYYPIKLRAPLRAVFNPLINQLVRVFGGRSGVYEDIINFIRRPAGGYMVITAPAGFGKSSLLANLVNQTPEAFAYHFFTPLYGNDTLTELFFLRNVVEQMASWHDHNEELPDKLNDLRALFHRFINEPLERTQVLVIDGLDEISEWSLQPYFSFPLPEHLHIIASVRDVGQDWRNQYAFPVRQTLHLPMEGLDRSGVANVLQSVGEDGKKIADDEELLTRICDIVKYETDNNLGADPLYVRYLAEDIRDALLTTANIDKHPRGLEAYLDRWWKEIKKLAGDVPTRDLFGTLAVAQGPVSRKDLKAINSSLVDDWAGDFFDEVLGKVRRMVMGDADQGYVLAHPRLRTYLADPKRIGKIAAYRDRVLEYCATWHETHSQYALDYYASHLAEVGRIDDLYQLFNGEWLAMQWQVSGSYARLVTDLHITMQAILKQDKPDYKRIAAMSVARQTARELMLEFPFELLKQWIRFGQVKQVLATVDSFSNIRGRSAEPLAIVARELFLRHKSSGNSDHELVAVALDLLGRSVDQLPKVRSVSQVVDALTCIADALTEYPMLDPDKRNRLLDDTLDFLAVKSDPTLHAVGIGLLAASILDHKGGEKRAADLLEKADAILADVDYMPNRITIEAFLLPVVQGLASGNGLSRLAPLLKEPAKLTENSSLVKNPLATLLAHWQPAIEKDRQAVIDLLENICKFFEQESDWTVAGLVAGYFIKLGLVERALELIASIKNADPQHGARTILQISDQLQFVAPVRLADWLEEAKKFSALEYHGGLVINRDLYLGKLSSAYAEIGKWDEVTTLLLEIRVGERGKHVNNCMKIALKHLADKPVELIKQVEVLLNLLTGIESKELAVSYIIAASVLADADLQRARKLMAASTAQCLGSLPEGSTDKLRKLLAVAYHVAGDYEKAAKTAVVMKWIRASAEALTYLLGKCDETTANAADIYIDHLYELLTSGSERSLYSDAIRKTADIQAILMKRYPDAAAKLDGLLMDKSYNLPIDDFIRCQAVLAASVANTDSSESERRFQQLVDQMQSMIAQGYDISAATAAEVFVQLVPVLDVLDPAIVDVVQVIEANYSDPKDIVKIRCGHSLATSVINCASSKDKLELLLDSLEEFRELAPGAFTLSRMIADFTGRRVGPRLELVNVANVIGRTIVQCGRYCPAEAKELLAKLFDVIFTIKDSPNDLAQAFVDLCDNCKKASNEFSRVIPELIERVVDTALALPEDLTMHVVYPALRCLLSIGDITNARTMIKKITKKDYYTDLESTVNIAKENAILGKLSMFDEALVTLVDEEVIYSVLYAVRVNNEAAEIEEFLGTVFVDEQLSLQRYRLLSEFVPLLTVFPHHEDGAAAIATLVDEVESFDHSFIDAARMVEQSW